jgi:hypothetical protein
VIADGTNVVCSWLLQLLRQRRVRVRDRTIQPRAHTTGVRSEGPRSGTLLVLKVVDWMEAAGSIQPEELALLHEGVSSGTSCNDNCGCIGQRADAAVSSVSRGHVANG